MSYHLLPGVAFGDKKNSSHPVMSHIPKISKYTYIPPSFCPDYYGHFPGSGQEKMIHFHRKSYLWSVCLNCVTRTRWGRGRKLLKSMFYGTFSHTQQYQMVVNSSMHGRPSKPWVSSSCSLAVAWFSNWKWTGKLKAWYLLVSSWQTGLEQQHNLRRCQRWCSITDNPAGGPKVRCS